MERTEERSVIDALAAPMPYKWRLKQVANKVKRPYPDGTRGQFLGYIDARDVMNRLDQALGSCRWQSSVKRINEDGSAVIALSLRIGDDWLTKEDVGYPNNPGAGVDEEPLKAAVSDGLKRAAVHWGVGRFLYDLPPIWTEIDANGQPIRPLNGETRDDRDDSQPSFSNETKRPQPLAIDENQPCAIDGCAGVCIGSWVGFSMRRYGVALCSKHSAMAKRGELDGELRRVQAAS